MTYYVYYAGFAGAYETGLICQDKKEELLKGFPHQLLERAIKYKNESFPDIYFVMNIGTLAINNGARAWHSVNAEGSFKALWDLGEALESGFEVNLSDIPVTPETIEISEHYDLNPYRMDSTGAIIYVAKPEFDEQIQKALSDAGINSARIGKLTNNADRIVRYDNNIHYLTPRGE